MHRLVLLLSLLGGCLGSTLVSLGKAKSSGSQCCNGPHILSCDAADVQIANLGSPVITLPGDLTLNFQSNPAGNPNAFFYSSQDGEAVISLNPSQNGLHGHAMTASGKSLVLEYCGASGHVWKSLDVDNMPGDHGVEFPSNRQWLDGPGDFEFPELELPPPELPPLELPPPELPPPELTFPELQQPELLGQESSPSEAPYVPELPPAEGQTELPVVSSPDNTTVVTYTLKMYYTQEVEDDTADLDGFFQQIIDETNQGYENSGIPLKIELLCSQKIDIPESGSAIYYLNNFTYMANHAITRDGADSAALIVLNMDYCGYAWLNTLTSGYTLSVTKKTCATGYYSFGHEIGHNIGATHDPATSTNSKYPYGHGHLIAQGAATTGYRTIMAYSADGHYYRVNYWSNPAVTYPLTGTPTGVAGVSNNAALLTANRYQLAAVGKENSATCSNGATVTTTMAPVTIPPSTCQYKNKMPQLKRYKRTKKVKSATLCKNMCQGACQYWLYRTKSKVCDLHKVIFKKGKNVVSGGYDC